MDKHTLEQKIRTAVEHAAPDRLEQILSACEPIQHTVNAPPAPQPAPGARKGATPMLNATKKTGLALAAAAAAVVLIAAACLRLLPGASGGQVDSVILLDVNPSLSLSVDDREKVLSAEALNADAEIVLGDMDLEGASLEVAVNALIGSMLRNGYLADTQNSVLVSVESRDAARSGQLQQKVAEAVTSAAQTGALDAAVLSQSVRTDDEALAALAQEYGISLGKAALIQEVIAQCPTLTFDDLAPMIINEIALIAASRNVSSSSVMQSGTASDTAYIGQSEALRLACAHAGVSEADLLKQEVEFDSEHGVMLYEVEFKTAVLECEYKINARTGEVLTYEVEDHAAGTKAESGSTGTAAGGSYIGEAAARAAALAHAGVAESSTAYVNCRLEYEKGQPHHYCVEFKVGKTEYEYEIDLYSGAVLEHETESHDDHGTAAVSGNTACIGESAALAAALNHAGVSEASLTKKEIELHREGDGMVYEVEFEVGHAEYHYEIDAATGAVLKAQDH